MSRERDTDTLTRIDMGPDAPTVKNSFTGDETHRVDPRAYAPLRVCPQCSLAWEITGEWCPSCGTAFDKSAQPTRVQPAAASATRPGKSPPLNRSARRRGITHPPVQAQPPRRAPQQQPQPNGSSGFKTFATVLIFAAAIAVAFFVGQSTRASSAQVDQRVDEAVQTAKRSAASSYERAFDKMQAQAAAAIEAAREKGLAEGKANAQAQIEAQQQQSQSIFDGVTNCVLRGDC
ncbi:MAG: hypothetical protein JHD02_05340 [Thermoleophilaceae bacterium]|nr:hypothetical protein [Thermoleophilaceae bacterium]